MQILIAIAYFAVTIGLMILLFTLGKKYVFSKVRINKWIPLAIALVLFLAQFFIKTNNMWINMGLTLVIVWFFLWFFDIQSTGGPKKKEKKIEIRPKAKPNRVKHMQNQKDN
ncbi:hypothetical protein NSA50_06380 [Clostridium sp. DSM 100503]|uniref:hypothetical protein n=1 Tax=Clostridium sp. DSM 100503 TaxID=2963282 RepID=UPI00214A2772|nr:hypothetical protein [Clostridium sp. DSM 100503]MCR1950687.1 hypothetical protein [Clostridium sp. DSM 100503]